MLAELLTKFYDAHISSLEALAIACAADERQCAGKITNLELGTNSGAQATKATYEITGDMTVRELAFVEYKSDVDEHSLKAKHTSKGYDFLFKGAAYIQNNSVKLLAFGGHEVGDPP